VFKYSAEYEPADDRLVLLARPPCHGSLTGHMRPAAGLRFSVPGNPGSGMENLAIGHVPDPLSGVHG